MIGHEGLQRMRTYRQPQARHRRNTRDVSADSTDYGSRGDVTCAGLNTGDPVALHGQAIYLGTLVHVRPALHGPFGERPDDPVVARCRPFWVIRGPMDRPEPRAGDVDLRTDFFDFARRDEHRPGPERRVDFGACVLGAYAHLAMGDPEEPFLAVHQIPVGLFFQTLVQIDTSLIETHCLGDTIVGPDDRRVATGVTTPDVPALKHGDVGDAVACCQVIGGREPMATTTDDYNIVVAPGFVPLKGHFAFNSLDHAMRLSRVWASGAGTRNRTRSSWNQSFTGTPATAP